MKNKQIKNLTREDFIKWGRAGGQKASHALSPEKAREMVRIREMNRKKKEEGKANEG